MAQLVTPEIRCEELTDEYGRFVAEPLEGGYGTTVGNALRRVLLSSLEGSAVTWVRIEGVQHEFSTMPHVREDTIEFLLNVKDLRLRPLTDRPGRLYLEATGPGEVTGADIKPSADYEVVNPEVHLATLDSSEARLYVEFNVEQGRGYEPAAQRIGLPIGVLPLDAIFTPVRRVNYRVEPTRVGQTINYDRLILEVWTDGTISPTSSLNQSAELLIEQVSHWANFGRAIPLALGGPVLIDGGGDSAGNVPIEELNLSVRAYNALKRHNITRVREILAMSDEELLSIRNFGDKSKQELREALIAHGYMEPGEDDIFVGEIPAGGYVASPDDDDDED